MARVSFPSLLNWFHSKIRSLVLRHGPNVKLDMSRVVWGRGQRSQRRDFGDASTYASAAMADPEIRAVYIKMAIEQNGDPRRSFEAAHQDYLDNGHDLLWKKYMGDPEKPRGWEMGHYFWYFEHTKRRW